MYILHRTHLTRRMQRKPGNPLKIKSPIQPTKQPSTAQPGPVKQTQSSQAQAQAVQVQVQVQQRGLSDATFQPPMQWSDRGK